MFLNMCHKNNSIPCLNTCTKLQKILPALTTRVQRGRSCNSFCTCAHGCIRGIVKFIEGKVRVLECIVWLSMVVSKKILLQTIKRKIEVTFWFCVWGKGYLLSLNASTGVEWFVSRWLTSFSWTGTSIALQYHESSSLPSSRPRICL